MRQKMKIRKPYDKPARMPKSIGGESLAKQSMAKECDINRIVPRAQQDGIIDHVNTLRGSYGDFSGVEDYQTHLNLVMAAEAAFMELPSALRSRCGNNTVGFMEFMENPENLEEQIKFGLVEKTPAPEKQKGTGGQPVQTDLVDEAEAEAEADASD